MVKENNKIFCDLCEKEVAKAKKEDGIWACKKCKAKYPNF